MNQAAIAKSFWQPAYPWIYSTRRQWTLNLTCWISLNAWDWVTDYFIGCHLCSIVVGGCMSVYCSSKTWNMNTWQHTGCTVWPKSVIHTSCRSESSCNRLVIFTKVELAYHLIYLTRIQWILNLTCQISLNTWDCVTDYCIQCQCHLGSIIIGVCTSVYCSQCHGTQVLGITSGTILMGGCVMNIIYNVMHVYDSHHRWHW